MAIVYVDSAAAGANNGTSWANAYTSLASVPSLAAGSDILMDDGHSEDFGTTTTVTIATGTIASPVRLLCVDKTNSDALSSGAVVSTTSGALTIIGNSGLVVDGVTFSSAGAMTVRPNTAAAAIQMRNCNLVPGGGFTFQNGLVELESCNLDFSAFSSAAQGITTTTVDVTLRNCTITTRTSGTTSLFTNSAAIAPVLVRASKIQGTLTNWVAASSNIRLRLIDCEIPTGVNNYATLPTAAGTAILLESCSNGTITAPNVRLSGRADRFGVVSSTLSRYRTGGADDGEQANAHAWELVSNANVAEYGTPLETPPLVRWVDAGSYTVTVYVASGVTLQDDEFYVECSTPSEAGSPTAQARFQSSRLVSRGTAADLTSDGASTWNGAGVGTKQKITFSIAPTVAGPVTVRCYLAKASTTVYLDPLLEVA